MEACCSHLSQDGALLCEVSILLLCLFHPSSPQPSQQRDYRPFSLDTSLWMKHKILLPKITQHQLRHTPAVQLTLLRLHKAQHKRHAALPWQEEDWIAVEAGISRRVRAQLDLSPDAAVFERKRLANYNKNKFRLWHSARLKLPKSLLRGSGERSSVQIIELG